MSRFNDDLISPDFDTKGLSSFYGIYGFDIIPWDTDIVFPLPISEQFGPHLTFK